jgi:hypothetical protein
MKSSLMVFVFVLVTSISHLEKPQDVKTRVRASPIAHPQSCNAVAAELLCIARVDHLDWTLLVVVAVSVGGSASY